MLHRVALTPAGQRSANTTNDRGRSSRESRGLESINESLSAMTSSLAASRFLIAVFVAAAGIFTEARIACVINFAIAISNSPSRVIKSNRCARWFELPSSLARTFVEAQLGVLA